MIFIILIAFLTFVLRAFPRVKLKQAYAADTYLHLYVARIIKENSFKIPQKLPKVILKHRHDYPFFYHFLLAIFPLKLRYWAERFTGAFFDTINIILLYYFSVEMVKLYNLSSQAIYFTTVLYAISPALLRYSHSPRAFNGSPRVLGQSLYIAHILAFGLFVMTNQWYFAVISVISGSLQFISTKFGVQVILFFSIFFSIFFSYTYILVLIASFIFSNIITLGKAFQVLSGHYQHSYFYFRYIQQIVLHQNKYFHKSFYDYQKALRDHLYVLRTSFDVYRVLKWFYEESYFLHIIFIIFTPFFILPFYFFQSNLQIYDYFLLTWAGAGFCMYLITKIKIFLFIGEAERYTEYALPAALLLMVKLLIINNLFVILYVLGGLYLFSAIFYIHLFFKNYTKVNQLSQNNHHFYDTINSYPEGALLALGSDFRQLLYCAKHPVLCPGMNTDVQNILPIEEYMLAFGNAHLPSKDFERVINTFDIQYIVTKNPGFTKYQNEILDDKEIINKHFEVVKEWEGMIFMKRKAEIEGEL